MDRVADRHQAQLGAVQETLFIPLAARARAARAKRPVLRDPKHPRAVGVGVRRPALAGAARPAGGGVGHAHPAARRGAPPASGAVPVSPAARRPALQPGAPAHPVPGRLLTAPFPTACPVPCRLPARAARRQAQIAIGRPPGVISSGRAGRVWPVPAASRRALQAAMAASSTSSGPAWRPAGSSGPSRTRPWRARICRRS